MSFRAVLWAMKQEIPCVPKLVLIVLASHASRDDGSCFPRVRTIGREASLSERTIHRYLPMLEQKKLVRIERRFEGKARQSHRYWLDCPCSVRDRQVAGTVDGRPYDTRGGVKNHKLNHNIDGQLAAACGRQGRQRDRTEPNSTQRIEQSLQRELARRLGREGWEILTMFDQDVPRLCARLRNGTLSSSELLDLRARYIEEGGFRRTEV